MRVMDEAVQNGISESGVADDFVPTIDRHLADDQHRTCIVAILDDFQKITALIGIEWFGSPIIEDEEPDAREHAQQLGIASVAAGQCKGREQTRNSIIAN